MLSVVLLSLSHAELTQPPSRNAGNNWAPGDDFVGCQSGSCMWFSQGCSIGCPCNGRDDVEEFWVPMRYCNNTMEPKINDPKYLSWNKSLASENITADWTRYHPWRAPGTATPLDACGLSGGSFFSRDPGGLGNMTIVKRQGFPGSQLPPLTRYKTNWTRGSTVEVAWGIAANHGGGYQYRLCPASEELTELCFQQHVLPFVGETQKLRWNSGKEVVINATRVSEGTWPEGSVWTKNPIPPCVDKRGGRLGVGCPTPQFEPPPGCDETCYGYQPCVPWVHGTHWQPKTCSEYPNWKTREIPSIVDEVMVPKELPAGQWVFQWRWDSEQTAQVWNACADVTIS